MDLDPKNLGVALRPSYYTLRNGGGKGRHAPGAAPSFGRARKSERAYECGCGLAGV